LRTPAASGRRQRSSGNGRMAVFAAERSKRNRFVLKSL
jgi:hypothetical protein